MDTAAAPRRHFDALTGLRAVAAAWVVLFHLGGLAMLYLDHLPVVSFVVVGGWTGVELFFVLSGFVIATSYAEHMGGRPSLSGTGRFLLNRLARVWPAWAVVTVVAGAWVYLLRANGWNADVMFSHAPADLPHLLSQMTMTHMWGRTQLDGAGFVLPGWSISAEWAAYLAFPLLALPLWRLRRLPAWSLFALAVLVMSPLSVIAFRDGVLNEEQNWGLRIACGFTAGALAGLAVRRTRRTARADSVALAVLVTCLVLVVFGLMWASWRRVGAPENDYAGVVVVLFPLIVSALAITERGPARWLSGRAMLYGGRVSYSLYLVHYVVIDVLLTVLWQDPGAVRLTPGLTLAVPVVVLLCFAAAVALHHGVEEPGRRMILAASSRFLLARAGDAKTVSMPRDEAARPIHVAVRVAVPVQDRRTPVDRPLSPEQPRTRSVATAAPGHRTVPGPRSIHPAGTRAVSRRDAVASVDGAVPHGR